MHCFVAWPQHFHTACATTTTTKPPTHPPHHPPQVYNVTSGKSAPEWVKESKKKSLKKNEDYRRRLELVQDFEMPAACQRIKVTPDQQFIFASGVHPPQVRVYDVNNLALKFDRHMDAEIVDFQVRGPACRGLLGSAGACWGPLVQACASCVWRGGGRVGARLDAAAAGAAALAVCVSPAADSPALLHSPDKPAASLPASLPQPA